MFIVTKLYLRNQLKVARREKDQERVAILEQVINDSDLLQLIHEANQAEYEYVRSARASRAGVYGNPFQDFLAFLFENREAIFEMILMFIQLLAILQPGPTQAVSA